MKTRKVWHHFSDVRLERAFIKGKNVVRVFDADGDHAFDLPGDLSEKEVETVMEVINTAYNQGFETGQIRRSNEICDLLRIESCARK